MNLVKKLKKVLLVGLILIVFYYVFTFYYIFKMTSLLISACIPIVIGFFIAFLLEPIICKIIRLRIDRKFAVGYVYFMSFVVIFITLRYLIPPIVTQIIGFIDQLPLLEQRVMGVIGDQFDFVFDYFDIDQLVLQTLNSVVEASMKGFQKILDQFMVFSLGLGASIYISFDYLNIKKNVMKLYPQKHFVTFWHVSKKIAIVTFEYIKGLLWDSFFLYIISIIALFLIDFEYPYVYALFITITNLIPYIGPYIGGILVGIVGFSSSITLGLKALIVVIICQYVESTFVQPIILKNRTDLHPVISVLGVSFFGSLFGIMGMVLSRLILLYIAIIYEELLKGKFEKLILEKHRNIGYNFMEIDDKEE